MIIFPGNGLLCQFAGGLLPFYKNCPWLVLAFILRCSDSHPTNKNASREEGVFNYFGNLNTC